MDDLLLPPKDEVFSLLLREGTVLVHIDARRDGLVLPSWLLGQTHVILELGYEMAIPIPDLAFDGDQLSATLSFQRQPFCCTVPWSSVFGMTLHDGRGLLFPEDVPAELRDRLRVLGDDDDQLAQDDEVDDGEQRNGHELNGHQDHHPDDEVEAGPQPALAAAGGRRRPRPRSVERPAPKDPRRGLMVLDGGVSSRQARETRDEARATDLREPLSDERPRPTHLRLIK